MVSVARGAGRLARPGAFGDTVNGHDFGLDALPDAVKREYLAHYFDSA